MAVFTGLYAIVSLSGWGDSVPITPIPWFVPTLNSFIALISASVAYLAFGRYQVLHDPVSFWVGTGCSGFAVDLVFNMLTFPGLLPEGGQILGRLANTSGWLLTIGFQVLGISLILANILHWPGRSALSPSTLRWIVPGWITFNVLASILFIFFEDHLPIVVETSGLFTSLAVLTTGVLLAIETILGAILSTRKFIYTGDDLPGYIAIAQFGLAAAAIQTAVSGVVRFELWWMVDRAIWLIGFLTMLFGFLSGYVRLFRRERERTAEAIEAREALIAEQDHRLDFYRRTIQAATDGKLIICDHEDIMHLAGPALAYWQVQVPGDLKTVRSEIEQLALKQGLDDPQRMSKFIICIGEASTNALKHAGSGIISLHIKSEALICVIEDHGTGIDAMNIPDVALAKGFSTARTLGMGYKIMIEFADRVYLATNPQGTTVAIEMQLKEDAHDKETGFISTVWKRAEPSG